MGFSIDIAIEHDAWKALGDLEPIVERAASAACAAARVNIGEKQELSLVFCDDAFIQTLNKMWRDKDRATNVLSFPADPSVRGITLGDIVIAYETTVQEAADQAKPLRDHVIHLIIHGVLHLLGFDHEVDSEADAMEGIETRALMTLGIASPYEDAACDDAANLRAPATSARR